MGKGNAEVSGLGSRGRSSIPTGTGLRLEPRPVRNLPVTGHMTEVGDATAWEFVLQRDTLAHRTDVCVPN